MGIDRQNIPDEYKCEVCQPRHVDKQRAHTLQVIKKEQQNIAVSNQSSNELLNQLPIGGGGGVGSFDGSTNLLSSGGGTQGQLLDRSNSKTNLLNKKQKNSAVRRKNEMCGTSYSQQKKAKRELSTARTIAKRRESKKPSKRKVNNFIITYIFILLLTCIFFVFLVKTFS